MLLALVHNIIANINGESPYEERRPTELDLHPHILGFHILLAQRAYGHINGRILRKNLLLNRVHYKSTREVPDLVDQYSPFSMRTSVWVIEASLHIFKSVALLVGRNRFYHMRKDGRAGGQTDKAQMS